MPWAVMPKDMKNKIAAYGDAVVPNWVSQQQVLDHPVGSLCALRCMNITECIHRL